MPYWETRGYVAIVIRNYWMYERQAGGPSESRQALAQGQWPSFPGFGTSARMSGSASSATNGATNGPGTVRVAINAPTTPAQTAKVEPLGY